MRDSQGKTVSEALVLEGQKPGACDAMSCVRALCAPDALSREQVLLKLTQHMGQEGFGRSTAAPDF